jgi:hypothetical protein
MKKIDGIIGSELLVRLQAQVDFEHFKISFTSAE